MSDFAILPIVVVLIVGTIVGVIDAWKFRVYNAVTLPLLATGIVYHGMTAGATGLSSSIAGAVFGAVILLIPYLLGGVGGGDVKLIAGIGAWLGLGTTGSVLLASFVAAGVYSLVLLAMSGRWRNTLNNFRIVIYQLRALGVHLAAEERVESVVNADDRRNRLIPFATMTAVGLAVVFIRAWFAAG